MSSTLSSAGGMSSYSMRPMSHMAASFRSVSFSPTMRRRSSSLQNFHGPISSRLNTFSELL